MDFSKSGYMRKLVLEQFSQYFNLWSILLEIFVEKLFETFILTEVLQIVIEVHGERVDLDSLHNLHKNSIRKFFDILDELSAKRRVIL